MIDYVMDNPLYAHLMWVVLGLGITLVLAELLRRTAMRKFADQRMWKALGLNQTLWRRLVKAVLLMLALTMLTAALMDIRWGRKWKDVEQRGVDVIFVLDVSKSMLAEDVTPSRLGRAKQMIRDMIEAMQGDRAGLVVFAGEARLMVPLTSSRDDFLQRLEEVDVTSVNFGGSRLGDAIYKAQTSFPKKLSSHQAIIVIGDGEDQESKPVDAALEAYEDAGIRVYSIGIGDPVFGSRIPLHNQPGRFVTHNGQDVYSRLDNENMEAIADAGNGVYLPAGLQSVDMKDVYERLITKLPEGRAHSTRVMAYEPRYPWFIGIALFLLVLEALLAERSWIRNWWQRRQDKKHLMDEKETTFSELRTPTEAEGNVT